MLYYNRIYTSEGMDLDKSNNSKECIICQYFFFNHGFKFQDYACNGCHDLSMLCLDISDIDIKMLIIVVLCITLASLKQLIY